MNVKLRLLAIIMIVFSINSFAQEVTGTVIDKTDGLTMPGVNVLVKGTTVGTTTDFDGNFSIEVPDGGKALVFSFMGYVTKTVVINGLSHIKTSLEVDAKQLDDVIVTALGVKREEKSLGYSVQKVEGESLTFVKGSNVSSSLTGKVAGLTIYNSSEMSEAPVLELRGENPLIVIDGVAFGNIGLESVPAEDIERLDVLKGATASALYGVRGRNGAIMITTKKGKEGKVDIRVSNNTMFSAGYLSLPEAQSSYSTGNYGKLGYNSGYVWGDYMDGREVEQYDPISKGMKVMPLVNKGKNNVENFFEESLVSNTNVSISQANEFGGYRLSTTHIYSKDQFPNSKKNKIYITGNGYITYGKFKLDANMSFRKSISPNVPKTNYGQGNVLYNMLVWGGTEYDVTEFKDYWKLKDQKQNWPFEAWFDNPYFLMNERINSYEHNSFNTSVNLTYSFTKDISLMFRTGFDFYNTDYENRRSMGTSFARQGSYSFDKRSGNSLSNDLILKAAFEAGDFRFDAIGGVSSYWYSNNGLNSSTRGGLNVPGFYSLNASLERPNTNKRVSQKMLYSVYGKFGVSWRSGVYLDFTGRNDWSSTLPEESRSYFYPSVSTSILPTSFYNPIDDVLDFWKIRSSWTVTKKDLGVYSLNNDYGVSTDVWQGYSTASYPSGLKNTNVLPESEESFEIGTDLSFYKNRIGFNYTYFTRLRYDRLMDTGISAASGSDKTQVNSGEELRQKGMEFTLTGVPVKNKQIEWSVAANLSFYHWYYDKLDEQFSSKDPRIKVGGRTDLYFMQDWQKSPDGQYVYQGGLPIKNNFTSILGNSDADYIIGFINTFAYKGFSLRVSVDGRIGGVMYSWTEQAMWNSGTHPDSDNEWRYDEVVNGNKNYVANGLKVVSGEAVYDPFGKLISDDRVFAANDVPVSYQSYVMQYNENAYTGNSQNVLDGSFIKLREVGLSYSIPKSLVKKAHMQQVKIGFVAQNLLMWTKEFKFSDPDRGQENLNSPTARYIGFNIDITL